VKKSVRAGDPIILDPIIQGCSKRKAFRKLKDIIVQIKEIQKLKFVISLKRKIYP